ncbi:uncharacterized protein [Montipora foliosa]|uniref:uncharacterized protein n=1 Tax=Montipora foliosa TaxID=591990 RepID=UPI0035F0FEE4
MSDTGIKVNSLGKAETLNAQFQQVFTQEDLSSIPNAASCVVRYFGLWKIRRKYLQLTKVLLSNVRSLVPKIDEIREFVLRTKVHLAFITETWLRSSISDSVVSIPDFVVIRKDRHLDSHGGVCAYVKEGQCKYKVLDELQCCESHEILWLHLRPNRLPRGFSCVIAAVVYHPPGADEGTIRDHLFHSLLQAETKYPNCGFIISGDFNPLNIKQVAHHFKLKQIVGVPTRNNSTLDLVFTNMHEFYNKPEAHPPFGLSDHNSRKSSKVAMGKFLGSFDWHAPFSALYTCGDMWNLLCKTIHTGLHILMPFKRTKICSADAPWMTQKLKSLILKRQKALNSRGSESSSFKHYRNLVNRGKKECRAEYYQSKIQNLKEELSNGGWRLNVLVG